MSIDKRKSWNCWSDNSQFDAENIKLEFDFANLVLKIIINNEGEEGSEYVPLYNYNAAFSSFKEELNKFRELIKNIRNAGIKICDEINAEELKKFFE